MTRLRVSSQRETGCVGPTAAPWWVRSYRSRSRPSPQCGRRSCCCHGCRGCGSGCRSFQHWRCCHGDDAGPTEWRRQQTQPPQRPVTQTLQRRQRSSGGPSMPCRSSWRRVETQRVARVQRQGGVRPLRVLAASAPALMTARPSPRASRPCRGHQAAGRAAASVARAAASVAAPAAVLGSWAWAWAASEARSPAT